MKYNENYCTTVEDILNEWAVMRTNVCIPEKMANQPKSIGIDIDLYLSDQEYMEENEDAEKLFNFMKKKFSSSKIYVFNPDELSSVLDADTFRHDVDAITRGIIYKDNQNLILDTGYKNIFVWEKTGGKNRSLPVIFSVTGILPKNTKAEFVIKDSEDMNL